MLKNIFSNTTRIKLFKFFFANGENPAFVREIERATGEQITAIRRELDNLASIGFLSSRQKLNRKYYTVNKDFVFYKELFSIIKKGAGHDANLLKSFAKTGKISLLVLCGDFVGDESNPADMLIVGDISHEQAEKVLNSEIPGGAESLSYGLLTEKDFMYRVQNKDKFVLDIISKNDNIVLLNKLKGKF